LVTSIGQTCNVRYLTVVRHAESVPATAGGADFERVLSERGRAQCAQLRAWASDADELGAYGPTMALVSAAARTRETFRLAFEGTPFAASCEYSELIYNGRREVSGEDLLIDLAAIDPVTTSLLVVAHNPTVLEVMLALSSELPRKVRKGHFPVGAAFVLALPEDRPVGLMSYEVVASYVPD
jgi:phosphohistidine phosphatase